MRTFTAVSAAALMFAVGFASSAQPDFLPPPPPPDFAALDADFAPPPGFDEDMFDHAGPGMLPPPPVHFIDGPGGPGRPGAPADAGDRDGPPRRHAHRMPHLPREIIAEFDTDKDGKLSKDERHAAHQALKARIDAAHAEALSRFDANGDGKLDKTERAAAVETLRAEGKEDTLRLLHLGRVMKQMHERMKSRADVNHDGDVSDAERAAAREEMKARMEAHRARMLREFDANKDGVLDETERAAARKEMEPRRRSAHAWRALGVGPNDPVSEDVIRRATEIIQSGNPRADFNGDGKVDQADLAEVLRRAGR